jgi:UDP-N-acetylmuramoyl-L-alanyl-D-glutamate--2,6-diaminopimelate ligase
MIVIAVTGTDGKTSTCTLIHSILKSSGYKVGLASTTRFAIGDEEWVNETHKTTLGRFYLQKLLFRMKKEKCTHLVLEVSSHALSQGRIIGIPVDTAVITNISREHLDFHKTLKNYKKAKLKLFKKLASSRKLKSVEKVSVCNLDDKSYIDILKIKADKYIGYGIDNTVSNMNNNIAKDIVCSSRSTSFKFTLDKEYFVNMPLIGGYNVYNALAAISSVLSFGVSGDDIVKGLESVSIVPGRFEIISDKDIIIAIDYAVTENAFEKLFNTARSIVGDKKVISVFGSCGDRDNGKRSFLGKISSELCDISIITDEEPYTEDPSVIRKMIISGIDKGEWYEEADRRLAIRKAISLANTGDIILVTGMGDQTTMIVGDEKIDWSDRKVIEEELKYRE